MAFRVSIIAVATLILTINYCVAGTGGSPNHNARQYLNAFDPNTPVEQHIIIVKFSSEKRHLLSKNTVGIQAVMPAFSKYGVYDVVQMYPAIRDAFTANGEEIGLDRMYRIVFSSNVHPLTIAREFASIPGVEYAEPERIHYTTIVPNDPRLAQQYSIDKMNLKAAWDITTGSRDVIVAGVDSGVHWTHEDLKDNQWINPGEDINGDGRFTTADINGVDDDGNGYIDDIIGIDLVGPDLNQGPTYYDIDPLPTPSGLNHGTHTLGIINAVGNNGKGIAGVAYGCRYLSIKCGPDVAANSIRRGYDGIVYAANMGARVINCSWGGEGGYLQSEEDQIAYAISKGAVVVASAGNSAKDAIFTPASYPGVLAVTSTTSSDAISNFSNYATWVDVSAPGSNILSTLSATNTSYGNQSGTSMAGPNAAGICALVASIHPEFTPLQIAEQVRISSDNIDASIPSRYKKKVGYGRVNALRALTVNSPSVRLIEYTLTDKNTGNGNEIFERGESIELRVRFKNYLSATKNAVVTFSTTNTRVTIQNPEIQLGVLGTMEEFDNESAPIIISLADEEALNDQVNIDYTISDDSYNDYGGLFFLQQPTYRDHNANNITTTISNDGNIGFDDFSLLRGKGYIYRNNGYNTLFEGALMIGGVLNGQTFVVDVARNESGNVQNADFIGTQPVLMLTPGPIAAQEGFTEFTDDSAPLANRLGLRVSMHSLQFTDGDAADVLIVKYVMKNTSSNTLSNVHAGLYFDWDISTNGGSDYAEYDTTAKVGYAYGRSGAVNTWVGATVLSRDKPIHFMNINNPDSDNLPIFGVHNGFTKQEKFVSMSSGILQRQSKINDISQVVGNGPYELAPGDSAVIAFALLAGYTKAEIVKATDAALVKWSLINQPVSVKPIPNVFGLLSISPNPVGHAQGVATLQYELQRSGSVQIQLYDALGRNIRTLLQGEVPIGKHALPFETASLAAGVYYVKLVERDRIITTAFTVKR